MKMITAQDARQIYHQNHEESTMFLEIADKIQREARLGANEIQYYTGGEHLPDEDLQEIKRLGYHIYWNSPCLWYEISW